MMRPARRPTGEMLPRSDHRDRDGDNMIRSGRGRDWAKKSITKRQAKRVARYYAGRLLADAVRDGWAPRDVVAAYGKDGLEAVREALLEVSWWMESEGDPKGRPCPTRGRKAGA